MNFQIGMLSIFIIIAVQTERIAPKVPMNFQIDLHLQMVKVKVTQPSCQTNYLKFGLLSRQAVQIKTFANPFTKVYNMKLNLQLLYSKHPHQTVLVACSAYCCILRLATRIPSVLSPSCEISTLKTPRPQ